MNTPEQEVLQKMRKVLKEFFSTPLIGRDPEDIRHDQVTHLASHFDGGAPYEIVAMAVSGDANAYDACVMLCEKKLHNLKALHPAEARFVLDVLHGKLKKKRTRGPVLGKHEERNTRINAAVWVVTAMYTDLPEYDAFDNGKVNACAIISDCLPEVGIFLEPDAVKKIWQNINVCIGCFNDLLGTAEQIVGVDIPRLIPGDNPTPKWGTK